MMGLELMQAKADVAKLQTEAKFKDEVFQAKIEAKEELLKSKDELLKSKNYLWQAIIESKDQQLSLLQAKEVQLQAKDAEIRRLHADLA